MVKPNYKSNDATGLLHYAERIFKKMTENATMFVNPVPELATLEEKLIAYRAAYAEADFRDKRAVIVKGKTGRELQEVIYRLSHYVDAVAKGDTEIIVAAGFTASQPTTTSIGRTPQATNLRVEHVQVGTGRLRIRVASWKYARLYQYDYRKKGTEAWTSVLHTKSVLEASGLDTMQEYEFRASYVGTDVTPNYSAIVTALVV